MSQTNLLTATIRQLQLHYWIIFSSLGLFLLLILFQLIPYWQESRPVSIILERYLIVITLIAIPLALKMFASKLKKSPLPLTSGRLGIFIKSLSAATLHSLCSDDHSHSAVRHLPKHEFLLVRNPAFHCLLFCRPSYQELENLLETPAGSDTGHLDNEDNIADDTSAGE